MSPPWMPLYIADYLADTRRLGAAEHGAYLLLIMEYWRAGSLPNDDTQLARIACMTDKEWRTARPVVSSFFGPDWRHARIDHELATAKAKYDKRAAAGKEGGKAKAARKQTASNASPELLANRKPGSTNHNHNPTDTEATASGGSPPDPSIEKRELFARGKAVFGQEAGGLVASILRQKGGNVALARAAVEQASQAENPREYAGRVVRPLPQGAPSDGASVVSAGQRLLARAREAEQRVQPELRCRGRDEDVRMLAPGRRS